MHGKQSEICLDQYSRLFEGLENKIKVARYHSLAAKKDTIPEILKVTAKTEDGEIMAVEHKTCPVYGLQFHPESILTPQGKHILKNFMKENI
jgi:Anthranilate/para-aminobenzoate synthases component II